MKSYTVTVFTYAPYKRDYVYRQNASCISVAISRAVKQFKQEPHIYRKRLGKIYIEAV